MKKYYKVIITKFSNLFLCRLDHSVLVKAETLRIIATFTKKIPNRGAGEGW